MTVGDRLHYLLEDCCGILLREPFALEDFIEKFSTVAELHHKIEVLGITVKKYLIKVQNIRMVKTI